MTIHYVREPTVESYTIEPHTNHRDMEVEKYIEPPLGISLKEHVAFIRNQLVIIMGAIKEIKGQAVEKFASPKLRQSIGEIIACIGEAMKSTDLVSTLYTR